MPKPNLTRRFYDQSPYPPPRDAVTKSWRLAPLEWILGIDRAPGPPPRRILVAGCGTGSEAFLLRSVFPEAEVVGVDFSVRSIRLANQTQRSRPTGQRVRFVTADLAAPRLAQQIGKDFDLVFCHGVLSYIPQPLAALKNLRRCLNLDGLLILGVNGASHFSASLRPVLMRLGIDVQEMPRGNRWRRLIQMWEVGRVTHRGPVSQLPRWYLGGDFFGPVNHCWPLHEWHARFRQAGLCPRASFTAHRILRPIVDSNATSLMLPCSRATVCELVDRMHPQTFHYLIVTRKPTPQPPWLQPAKLLAWRPARTGLYAVSTSRRDQRSRSPLVRLGSDTLDTRFEWPMSRWMLEIIRRCDGTVPIRALLRRGRFPADPGAAGEELFLLYQFGVLNFFPPTESVRMHPRRRATSPRASS